MKKEKALNIAAPLILLVILIAFFEIYIRVTNMPAYLLPAPSQIAKTFLAELGGKILPATKATITVIVVGYIIGVPIGVCAAALMSQIEFLNKALSPYIILIVCTPLISLVPLFMLTMGYGMRVRVLAVILQVFPIVMMNSFTGFNNVEVIKLELMKSMGASRTVTFFKVVLLDALPHVFTGLRLGTVFATITTISTEVVSGNQGLGNLLMEAKGQLKTDLVLAAVFVCAFVGILLYTLLQIIERKIVKWKI